ncbi:MAG: hypothetical protein U0T82_08540 [Bacteroidales bacterium]
MMTVDHGVLIQQIARPDDPVGRPPVPSGRGFVALEITFHDATDEKALPFRLLILDGHREHSEAICPPYEDRLFMNTVLFDQPYSCFKYYFYEII